MKRTFALILIAGLLTASLAACSGEPANPESSTQPSTSESAAAESTGDAEGSTTSGTGSETGDATGSGTTTSGTKGQGGDNTKAPTKAPTKNNTTSTTKRTTPTTGKVGGWESETLDYTPEEMDQLYPLRKNIKGTVRVLAPDNEDTKAVIKEFEKAYPDAKVEFYKTTASIYEKLMNLINAGDPPDFVYTTYQDFPLMAVKKLTMPIDEYIQSHPGQSSMIMNNFSSYNGKKYAVIHETPAKVLYYNISMFKSKNEKTPKEYLQEGNWTWDTLRRVAKKMTDSQKGIYGLACDNEYMFPLTAGEDVIKFVNGKPQLNLVNNKAYISAHQFFVDMVVKDKSTQPTHWIASTEFFNGKAAMVYASGLNMKKLLEVDNNMKLYKDYDFVPFPKKDKNSPYICEVGGMGGGFSIAAGARNIEGGMAFGEIKNNYYLTNQGNITYEPEVYEMCKEYNVQVTLSWFYGYGLRDLYFQGFCGWARTGSKDLSTLINENAPLMEAKLKEYT